MEDRALSPPAAPRAGPHPARRVLVAALLVLATLLLGGDDNRVRRWTFVDDVATPADLGLSVADPRGGAWELVDDPGATGARALVSRAGGEDGPPAAIVARDVRVRDVRAMTRCKVSATDHACGLVFRFVGLSDHHVAQLDASGQRIVLSAVRSGAVRVLAEAPAKVGTGVWYELAIEAQGDTIRVRQDGDVRITAHDTTPSRLGAVGLWTPSASEAGFDELVIEPLTPSPQVIELVPFFAKSG